MKKIKSLVVCLLGVFGLVSCGDISNNTQLENTEDKKPATMKEIKFDGTYVQTNDNTWLIAL